MPVGVKQFDLVSDWDARQSWDEGCNASGPEGPAAHNQGLATNYPPPSKGGHHLEKPRFFLNNSPSSSLQSYHRARMYTRIPTKIGMTKIGMREIFWRRYEKSVENGTVVLCFGFATVNDRTPVSFASLFQLLRATIQITFTVRVISEFKRV